MSQFNATNWNHCQYLNGENKAIISIAASPGILDDQFSYLVTVLDAENNEIFQRDFLKVDAACHFINTKYSEFWDFEDLSISKDTGGCSSCVAH